MALACGKNVGAFLLVAITGLAIALAVSILILVCTYMAVLKS